jgi:hypothetical protein
MTEAISGAQIVGAYEGPSTNLVLYRRLCGGCGYVSPDTICVSMLPHGTLAEGTYHRKRFTCPFCGKHQAVKLHG